MSESPNVAQKIAAGTESVAVIGLGYVGLTLAYAFARKKIKVIGFDINANKIELYKKGIDPTGEVGSDALKEVQMELTSDPAALKNAAFVIVAVPTPVEINGVPDLSPLVSASTLIGQNLKKGAVVVYESTVYPGATEEDCLPIIEAQSGMKCGKDFWVGYSPERVNPGDKKHRLETVTKVVSGMDQRTLEEVEAVYRLILGDLVYPAQSIRVAEAAKVIENAQRDLNIAFMNELALIFNKMGIDTRDVLAAAGTKWNFLEFVPGLVGGHCIGVDPYYLAHKAGEYGYHADVILAGRRINDQMGQQIAYQVVKFLTRNNKKISHAKVMVLGATFKENVPDARNSKVIDMITELSAFGVDSVIVDPVVDPDDFNRTYGLELTPFEKVKDIDLAILAVPHEAFHRIKMQELKAKFSSSPMIYDVKWFFKKEEMIASGFQYMAL